MELLGAFANAGKAMSDQLKLYAKFQGLKAKWERTQALGGFGQLEKTEEEYEAAHEYPTAIEHGEEVQKK